MLQTLLCIVWLLWVSIVQATPVEDWRSDALCGERMPDFQTTTLTGCRHASCTTLSEQTRLCVCEKERGNDSDESVTTVEKITAKGERTPLITTGYFPFYDNNAIVLHSLPLTGSEPKKSSLLLAMMATESNGIAIQRWQVWAITDDHVSKPIMVHDYGALSFATQTKNEKTCGLLVSQLLNGWEPKLGDGWYVTGHWFHLANDGEFFADTRPTIYHRFLNSFAEKRGIALFDKQYGKQPFLWYKEPRTKTLIGPDVFNYQDIFNTTDK